MYLDDELVHILYNYGLVCSFYYETLVFKYVIYCSYDNELHIILFYIDV